MMPMPPAAGLLDVYLSSDDGATWVQAAHIASHEDWALHEVHVADLHPADGHGPGALQRSGRSQQLASPRPALTR